MEIGPGIGERGIAQREEAPDIPFAQHRLVGVDIDREVEEVGDERNLGAVAAAVATAVDTAAAGAATWAVSR
jgi:hypothetical protein